MKRRYANKVDSLESFLNHGESVAQKSVALLKDKTCGPTFLPGPAGDVECLAYLCALDDVAKEIKGWAQETCKRLIHEHQKSMTTFRREQLPLPQEAIKGINRKGEFASLMLDRVHKTLGSTGGEVSLAKQAFKGTFTEIDREFSETRKRVTLLEQENMLMALRQNPGNKELLLSYGATLGSSYSKTTPGEDDTVLESHYAETTLSQRLGPKV